MVWEGAWAVSSALAVLAIKAPAQTQCPSIPCPVLSTADCANTGPKSLSERCLYKREAPGSCAFSAMAQRLGTCFLLSIITTNLIWELSRATLLAKDTSG